MAQTLIALIGGPYTGSRIPMPPSHRLIEGKRLKLKAGDTYELELHDDGKWRARYVDDAR